MLFCYACFQDSSTSSDSGIKGFFSTLFQRKKSSKSKRTAHAQPTAEPAKTPEVATKPKQRAPFMDLVALQSCEGCWELSEKVAEVLGNTASHFKAKQTVEVGAIMYCFQGVIHKIP